MNTSDGTTAQANHEACKFVELMEFSTDGQWLAYTSYDHGRVNVSGFSVWNMATEALFSLVPPKLLHGHVQSLSFFTDGQLLVSASQREDIYLWDVTTGHCIRHLELYGATAILASFDAGIKRRLNTQFGFLTIEDSGPGRLGLGNLDANICGDAGAAAQGLEKATCAESSGESSLPPFLRVWFQLRVRLARTRWTSIASDSAGLQRKYFERNDADYQSVSTHMD